MVLAVPDAEGLVFDVFKILRGEPTFIGTYVGESIAEHLFFSADTNTMLLINNDTAKIWDISKPAKTMAAERFAHMSANKLIQLLCEAEMPEAVTTKDWRNWVGLDLPPANPCNK